MSPEHHSADLQEPGIGDATVDSGGCEENSMSFKVIVTRDFDHLSEVAARLVVEDIVAGLSLSLIHI